MAKLARIILASKSPQRKALLKSMGMPFTAIPSDVEETSEGEPREVVLANALAKGHAVAARRRTGTLVIAGDTEVVVDGRVVGQPAFEGEARWCLETLSGRTHEVLGALALIGPGRVKSRHLRQAGSGADRSLPHQRRVAGEGRRLCGAGSRVRPGRRDRGRRL